MDVREKLVELLEELCVDYGAAAIFFTSEEAEVLADHLIDNGVTVQECCHKAESVISQTGLMCTACLSDIDRDAMFCKYCGAKAMPKPPKGE